MLDSVAFLRGCLNYNYSGYIKIQFSVYELIISEKGAHTAQACTYNCQILT